MLNKAEARDLFLNLNKLGDKKGAKFSYAIARNLILLKPEMEALDKAMTPVAEFLEIDNKRVELVKKFAKKNDKNELVLKNNNEYELEDSEAFNKEFEALKKDNKEVFDARAKQVEEYIELLKMESDTKLYKVSLHTVPEDITVTEMFNLREIISEDILSPFTNEKDK